MIRLINTYISFPNSKDTLKQSHLGEFVQIF